MHKIVKIVGVQSWTKDNKFHTRTHAVLEDGSEVQGYGSDFEVGNLVESFFDEEHDVYKMRKTPKKEDK